MSVIRPRPPTDPIHHHPPTGAGGGDPSWARVLAAAAAVRPRVVEAGGDPALRMLEPYGTTRSRVCRRDSRLFAILDVARTLRESVDRVIVIGDAIDRAAVDLLVATCCHPFHDALPRSERGGRPRMLTLGPGDDDDTVQGVLDLLATKRGDRLSDSWGLVLVGPCATPETQRCARLLLGPAGGRALAPPSGIVIAAGLPRSVDAESAADWIGRTGRDDGEEDAPAERVFTAAGLLPAAVAGVDVVRLLEGAAAIHRRFSEAPPEANPVLGCAVVGPWVQARIRAAAAPPKRRIEAEGSRWAGLAPWHAGVALRPAPEPIATVFTTLVRVGEWRRSPFERGEDADRAGDRSWPADTAAFDSIALPRCDEHAIGQLLALLRLAAEIERRMA
jgi:hypothetical protein